MSPLNHLRGLNFGATGTIRQNRIPRNCRIMDTAEMKKKPRVTYDHAYNGKVIVVKWKDNHVVTVALTAHGVAPLSSAGLYSREERKSIQVLLPRVFQQYNKAMGGTDQMDCNVANTELVFS